MGKITKTWRNSEKGEKVHSIIEGNFSALERYTGYTVLSLSSEQRVSLPEDYRSENLIVYDTTNSKWFQYKQGTWREMSTEFVQQFSSAYWVAGQITIPYSIYQIDHPIIQVYGVNEGTYIDVLCDIAITANRDIVLSSDIAFDGVVIIK